MPGRTPTAASSSSLSRPRRGSITSTASSGKSSKDTTWWRRSRRSRAARRIVPRKKCRSGRSKSKGAERVRKVAFILLACSLAAVAEDGFRPLFNGKDLDGWDGDPRLWSVHDGMIVGSTEHNPMKHNEFLISKRSYGNFILKAEMKLRNHNSGIQFRSEALPEWVMRGYQADAAENNYWGCLYEEKGTRGILVNSWKDKGEKVVHLKDWNSYEILCEGNHIQLKL